MNKLDSWLIRTSTIHNRVHELLGIIKWIWIAECVYNHVLYSTLHSLKALWVIRNVSNQICYSYQLQERTIFLTDSVTSNFWTFIFWHHSFSVVYVLSFSYLIFCKLVEKWKNRHLGISQLASYMSILNLTPQHLWMFTGWVALVLSCIMWQYGLWSFQVRGYKIRKIFA